MQILILILLLYSVITTDSRYIQDKWKNRHRSIKFPGTKLEEVEGYEIENCTHCSTNSVLHLKHLSDPEAVCNDGTRAGYYIRRLNESPRWIIYLQGGLYCNEIEACRKRFQSDYKLMTNRSWPLKKEGEGILSTDRHINPLAWSSNLIYIPYCTSDLWLGDASAEENLYQNDFHFRGARVINKVVDELIETGMVNASHVLLTGTSAGGVGVMIHIDKIVSKLRTAGSHAEVRGISDSGWFVENGKEVAKQPLAFWKANATMSEQCLLKNKGFEYKCVFGANLYPHIKAPLMVVQFYYDEYQMFLKGISLDSNTMDSLLLREMIAEVRTSLKQLDTVFGVSCFGHGILDDTTLFSELSVHGVTLVKAIECWYMGKCSKRNLDICETFSPLFQCNKSCPKVYNSFKFNIKDVSQGWHETKSPAFYSTVPMDFRN